MRFFIFILFFLFVSCDYQTDQEKFVEIACDTYELPECGFSQASRSECEKFVNAVYDGSTPKNSEKCINCLENIGCEMWTNSEKCIDDCEGLFYQ